MIPLFLVGCQPSEDLSNIMLGKWENQALHITVNTVSNTQATNHLDVPEGEWEKVLRIKPIQTTYTSDGKYTSTYLQLDGEKTKETIGEWSVEGDSLILSAQGVETKYKVYWEAPIARFIGYLDWDQDGNADDHYDGTQIKLKAN